MSGAVVWMTVVLVVYLIGIYNWRRPWLHRRLMISGIVADLGLTLYLEVFRGVIGQSISGEHQINKSLLAVHVTISVLLLLSYGFVWWSARRYRKAPKSERSLLFRRHRRLGFTALTLYLGSYVTAPGWIVERLLF